MGLFNIFSGKRKSYDAPAQPVENIWQVARLGAVGSVQYAFIENIWTHAAIKAISTNIASVPFKLRRAKANGMPGRDIFDPMNPWVRLFDNPNPSFDNAQLWKATSTYYEAEGQAFWVLRNAGGALISSREEVPSIIEVVGPRQVQPVMNGLSRYPVGWNYTDGVQTEALEDFQMLRFYEFNPLRPERGVSPALVASLSIGIDQKAHTYNDKFFKNGGQIPGYLLDENKDSELSDEQGKGIIRSWMAQFAGLGNAHRTPLLTNGVKFVPTGTNQKDMDFQNLVLTLRDEILAAFNVPKNQVGVFDGMNYANSKVADRQFYTNNLIPKMRYFASVVNSKLLYGKGYEVYFDLESIDSLKDARDQRARSAKSLFDMGFPLNNINDVLELGMDRIKDPWANEAIDLREEQMEKEESNPDGQPDEAENGDGKDPSNGDEHPPADKNPNPKAAQDAGIFGRAFDGIADLVFRTGENAAAPSAAPAAPAAPLQEIDGATSAEAFDAEVSSPVARKLRPKIVSTLTKMRNDQLARLEKVRPTSVDQIEECLFDQKAWADYHIAICQTFGSEAAGLATDFTAKELDSLGMELELGDDEADCIETASEAAASVDLMVAPLRLRLLNVLTDGISSGKPLTELKELVRGEFKAALSVSATMAHTEVMRCAQAARMEVMRMAGCEKVWKTGCQTSRHEKFGQTGQHELDFVYKDGLSHPCDSRANYSEIVGCKCHIIPARKK